MRAGKDGEAGVLDNGHFGNEHARGQDANCVSRGKYQTVGQDIREEGQGGT